ncbi:hypothetical protein RirG_033610 [Rhizophagus irregularis DAOM 197198w]|uniref:Uncharacterized protein n=1 Tax=Rhizophagus irregularis (strain DAOM 197198w) TaxID=1432141 RepID=A0A015K3K8_RHIIW|nr:hypothetical protein RirG_033610 [Rhizophagus irregularis DAOM 197198w]
MKKKISNIGFNFTFCFLLILVFLLTTVVRSRQLYYSSLQLYQPSLQLYQSSHRHCQSSFQVYQSLNLKYLVFLNKSFFISGNASAFHSSLLINLLISSRVLSTLA